MRHLIIEDPVSSTALWSRRLAVFSIGVVLVSILLARLNWAEPPAVLAVFGSGLVIAILAILFTLLAAVVIWRTGYRGTGVAIGGCFLALLVLAFPLYLAVQAYRLPELTDISTDVANPPPFLRTSKALKARSGFVPADLTAEARVVQVQAYPFVQPIELDLDPKDAFPLVVKTLNVLKWRIADQEMPSLRSDIYRIDAIPRSLIMGFPEAITIRVRPLGTGSRIDVRSVSRYVPHDFGSNASRIRKFVDELQAQLEAR